MFRLKTFLVMLFSFAICATSFADVQSYSNEDVLIKIEVDQTAKATRFEFCNRNGEQCHRLGNKDWYTHQELNAQKLTFWGIAAGWGTMATLTWTVTAGAAVISGPAAPFFIYIGGLTAGGAQTYGTVLALKAANALRKSIYLDKDVRMTNVTTFAHNLDAILHHRGGFLGLPGK